MKPSWKDAPDWANWLTKDGSGEYWWWDEPPDAYGYGLTWEPKFYGKSECSPNYGENDGIMTLEQSP